MTAKIRYPPADAYGQSAALARGLGLHRKRIGLWDDRGGDEHRSRAPLTFPHPGLTVM